MRSLFILLCLIVAGKLLSAQESYPNCTNPKKIKIPLVSNNDDVDQIYYQEADEYTYWYQLLAEDDCILTYKITSIEETDDYELLIYKHQEKSFCNALIKNSVKPISISKEGALRFKKGENYFFNVVYLNGNGCGHNLSLKTGENKLNIKAIQNECVEEVMAEIVEEELEEEELAEELVEVETKVEEVIEKPKVVEPVVEVVEDNKIIGWVINSKTKQTIDATVHIVAYNNIPSQQIFANAENGFELDTDIDEKIIASIIKLGYKTFYDTIVVNSDSLTIQLEPIDVGEKLIMNKVYFHPNTFVLKEESKKELNKLLDFMLENKEYFFEIQGHTNGNRVVKKTKRYGHLGEDWNFKGTSKKLSKLRAEKIKTYLIKNGVHESQLQTVGYGGDKMIVKKPKNMSQAMKNIRVEVIVIQ
ncbi:MAG: OmpA family protein [Vicingaceae bacterium]|nr:OmpA family protein [Vicingaceae bacterium]